MNDTLLEQACSAAAKLANARGIKSTDALAIVAAYRDTLEKGQSSLKFLVNGTRFKMSFFQNENRDGDYIEGTHVMCFDGYEKSLDGKWVALVDAEDNRHLEPINPICCNL